MLSKIFFWFGLLMVVVYIFAGIALIYFNVFLYIQKEVKTIFGIFFIIYGLFRFVRIYPKSKDLWQKNNAN